VSVEGGETLVSDYLEPVRWWKVGEVKDATRWAIKLSRQGPEHLGIVDDLVATEARLRAGPDQRDFLVRASDRSGNEDANRRSLLATRSP
jgi:hypothetical protein